MNKYGVTALEAVQLCTKQPSLSPKKAWQTAANKCFGESTSAADKGCPKNAFLGLCEEGLIEGIEPGSYTRSKKNKQYALKAVEILKRFPSSAIDPKQLWDLVLPGKIITHNSQMDVVLSLRKACLIKNKS